MKLMGFNFTKINVEKMSNNLENLKLNTKIDISEISDVKSNLLKTKDEIISVRFSYGIFYDPDVAKIEFEGGILLALDSKKAREVLKQWKDKKIPDDFRLNVFNLILKKSSLRALQLEEELNLPTHFPLPSLKLPENKEE